MKNPLEQPLIVYGHFRTCNLNINNCLLSIAALAVADHLPFAAIFVFGILSGRRYKQESRMAYRTADEAL